MSLTIKVLSFKGQPITEIIPVSFGKDGGGIGRSDDNKLILPDKEKFVSRHHAQVSYNNGFYYLSDNSLSGVFINGQQTPLLNQSTVIDNGTNLKIGEYELSVTISEESINDDFPFKTEPDKSFEQLNNFSFPTDTPVASASHPLQNVATNEFDFLPDWEEVGSNSLMSGHFSGIEELVEQNTSSVNPVFESGLKGNQSPLSDSYQAPSIISPSSTISQPPPSSVAEEIPENFSFDDFFSNTVPDTSTNKQRNSVEENISHDDFDAFLGAAISEMSELDSLGKNAEVPTPIISVIHEENEKNFFQVPLLDNLDNSDKENVKTIDELSIPIDNPKTIPEKSYDPGLLDDFLKGLELSELSIAPEKQKETLYRVGQIFRKLIDGTVAVLRSRAEFKSLCRVNMTVISASNNNPLKFTVSTDDVLKQLLENHTEGFKEATSAIEESFSDIMNHQLAMQAGIQASLTDLLKSFDPRVIEKQFEQGIVLQKKAKCWEKFEETYLNTVEDAVENFYGDEFVKAYEQQIKQLTNQRKH